MTVNEWIDTLVVCNRISESDYKDIYKSIKVGLDFGKDLRKSELKILSEGIQDYDTRKFINILYTFNDIRELCENNDEYDRYLLDIAKLSEQYRREGKYPNMIVDNLAHNARFIRLNKKKRLDFFRLYSSSYQLKIHIDKGVYTIYSMTENYESEIEYFSLMNCKFGKNIFDVALLVLDEQYKSKIYFYPEIKTRKMLIEIVKKSLKEGCKLIIVNNIGDCMEAFLDG